MKNVILSSAVLIASFSFGGIALACDLHGAGYGGYGLRNAPWQPYNPQVSTTDPAFDENGLITPVPTDVAPPAKAKPSFSNAANNAASKAKVRVLKKVEADKTAKQVTVKKAALNADRKAIRQ